MIECKICRKTFKTIPWSHLHYRHKMTPAEYKRKFKVQFIHSPEARQKIGRHLFGHAVTDREPTPEERKEFHGWMNQLWKQPRLKKKLRKIREKAWKNKKRRKGLSARMKKQWADPQYSAQVSEALKKTLKRPEVIANKRRIFKELWKDTGFRKKMAKRKPPPGAVSKLTDDQWREVIGWLKKDPKQLGIQAVRLNLIHLAGLIRERWGVTFGEKNVHYHLTKRGCFIAPIGTGEKPDFSNVSLRYRKWVVPHGH